MPKHQHSTSQSLAQSSVLPTKMLAEKRKNATILQNRLKFCPTIMHVYSIPTYVHMYYVIYVYRGLYSAATKKNSKYQRKTFCNCILTPGTCIKYVQYVFTIQKNFFDKVAEIKKQKKKKYRNGATSYDESVSDQGIMCKTPTKWEIIYMVFMPMA